MEPTFTTDACGTKSMFTTPRICLVPADGTTFRSTQPETGGRKILHISRAEENGGSRRYARCSVR